MNEAKLIAEVTVLTEMVRVLSDRIAQMDAEKTLQALHDENVRLGLYEQGPFGYFKAEPFGWTDCAETDEGAIALYEGRQQFKLLTDEEIDAIKPFADGYEHREYARVIETKLKKKTHD
jgi:hypothetical protein